jgi:protein involved in polysaccharide export with SLBB domain
MRFSGRKRKFFIVISAALLSLGPKASLNAQGSAKALDVQVVPFGYDIFRQPAEPILEGSIDDQFVLSPGDEIAISVFGQLNLSYVVTVSEEGYIEIPDEGGRIPTNGVSLRELKQRVTVNLSRIYSAYINPQNPAQSTATVDVKLVKVRKIVVYVLGEVKNQGAYTISAGAATLINLLNNAGGVKETGSLREIKIRRSDGAIDTVDFYDLLISGKIDSKKTQIRYGDYIIVPVKVKSVSIKGEVKRAGLYEAVGNEGLKDLIRFAGGLSPNAYLKRAQVKRNEINAGEKFLDLDLASLLADPAKDFILADGDEATLFPNIVVRRPLVEIQGSGVKRPGVYQFNQGMTIKDLIDRAEGLKEDVYLARADLVRTADDFSKRLTIFSLQDLYRQEQPGRIVFAGQPDKNFPLVELDVIMTYSSFEMTGKDKLVRLDGHVKQPGEYVLAENMSLYDLIFSRGGFQDEDFKTRTYLELGHVFRKVPGEVEERVIPFNLGKLLAGEASANMALEGFDRVVVYTYEILATKPQITIEGLVNRPGNYPLSENLTLEDLILIAGGLRQDAYKVEAVIGRTGKKAGGEGAGEVKEEAEGADAGAKKSLTILVPVEPGFALLPPEKKTRLEVFDRITVRNLPGYEPQPVVSVEGQVVYPGNYSLESLNERTSGVVRRAGGLKSDALAEGAVLFRRQDIVEMTRETQALPEKVAINLKGALDNPGGEDDLIMRNGDRLFIPYNPGTVDVRGAVRNPAIFQHQKGKGLKYYLDLSGGYGKDADKGGTVVYHPNGMAARRGFLSGPEILPGSVVVVPFKGEDKEFERVEVRGAVKNPIIVQYRKGERLKYYIDLGGGLKEEADADNIVVHFGEGEAVESRGAALFNPTIPTGSVIEVPYRTMTTETPEGGAGGIAAAAQERMEVGDVEVRGAVGNPGVVRFRKDMKVDYYIAFCGGVKENADLDKIAVHMPDGRVVQKAPAETVVLKKSEMENAALRGIGVFNPGLKPGCVIEIPFKETKK